MALSLIREIAPVITALIRAGKISSGIGAELGSMKVTEQIDAMEVSAINPGFFIGLIGFYKAFTASNGTESVGKAIEELN